MRPGVRKSVKCGATDGGMTWSGAQINDTLTLPKGLNNPPAVVYRHHLGERGCRVVSDARAGKGAADAGRKPGTWIIVQGLCVCGPIDLRVCLPQRCLHRAGSLKRQIGET